MGWKIEGHFLTGSTEGLTASKVKSRRRRDTGHMSTRDRLGVEVIVNHK
jgi:hypothetical protein